MYTYTYTHMYLFLSLHIYIYIYTLYMTTPHGIHVIIRPSSVKLPIDPCAFCCSLCGVSSYYINSNSSCSINSNK